MKRLLTILILLVCATTCRAQLSLSTSLTGVIQAPIDANGWRDFKVAVSQNVTSFSFIIIPPAQPPAQAVLTVEFTENATGGFTVAFGSGILSPCTVVTTASTTTVCQFIYDGPTGNFIGYGSGGTGGTAFSAITSGTNTTAVMVVGTGASLSSVPEFDIGAVGTNGVLGLKGTTSGKATFTAPAIAGTSSNPVISSNSISFPDNIDCSTPHAITFTSDTTTGIGHVNSTNSVDFCVATAMPASVTLNGVSVKNSGRFLWSNSGNASGSPDTDISRPSAGVVNLGTGSGDTGGVLQAAGFISEGTKFTASGCTNGTLVGGATAGKFTVGQATACTIVITMGNTATSPNGWTCTAYDQTAVPAVAIRQTASNATTCSLLMTVATNDVVTFSAIGF